MPPITVADLIRKLSTLRPDLPVYTAVAYDGDVAYVPATGASIDLLNDLGDGHHDIAAMNVSPAYLTNPVTAVTLDY
jgi:hypothetical protein